MSNVPQFLQRLAISGSDVIFHREEAGTSCPCLSPEGYRDPKWHEDNPLEPVCNEQGKLSPTVTNATVKAFVQPIQSTRATRLTSEFLIQMFGEIEQNDHLGIFPYEWGGITLSFDDWGKSGEDFITYRSRRFTVVNVNEIPDPADGELHHVEVGLRLMKTGRPE